MSAITNLYVPPILMPADRKVALFLLSAELAAEICKFVQPSEQESDSFRVKVVENALPSSATVLGVIGGGEDHFVGILLHDDSFPPVEGILVPVLPSPMLMKVLY